MKHTPRVVIPPHRNVGIALCEGRKNPLKASRRNILFLCCRWQIPPRILLFPIGAEISFYGSFYHLRRRWPASHLSGLRRSRCPAKCTGRGMAPHPQAAGRSPHPLLATIGEKHEKRYQIQHAHGIHRPRENQSAGGEGPYVHERLGHRLLSRQADHRHRRAKGTAPPAQGHRKQCQPPHRPRQHGQGAGHRSGKSCR